MYTTLTLLVSFDDIYRNDLSAIDSPYWVSTICMISTSVGAMIIHFKPDEP